MARMTVAAMAADDRYGRGGRRGGSYPHSESGPPALAAALGHTLSGGGAPARPALFHVGALAGGESLHPSGDTLRRPDDVDRTRTDLPRLN